MADRSPPGGFRTLLAEHDRFPLVLEARKQAYREIMNRIGLADDSMRDEFDEMPNSRSFLLVAPNGAAAGSVRASVHVAQFDWATLPLSKYHPEEMARLAEQRIPVVQSSILGVAPDYRGLGPWPTLSLIRAIFGTALAFGIDRIVTLVDPRPAKRRYWARIGWRSVEPPVPHPYSDDGALLLIGSVAESLAIVRQSPEFGVLAAFVADIPPHHRFPQEV